MIIVFTLLTIKQKTNKSKFYYVFIFYEVNAGSKFNMKILPRFIKYYNKKKGANANIGHLIAVTDLQLVKREALALVF